LARTSRHCQWRRTLAAALPLRRQGYESDWVERQLAHGDPDKIRGTYNKAQYLKQRREMMQTWSDLLDSNCCVDRLNPQPQADLAPFEIGG
jgi:hypothetical protein